MDGSGRFNGEGSPVKKSARSKMSVAQKPEDIAAIGHLRGACLRILMKKAGLFGVGLIHEKSEES